jgi:hypothetical protein
MASNNNNKIKFKFGSDQDYQSAIEDGAVQDSTLYFVTKDNLDNDPDDGYEYGGTIYKGNVALGTTCAEDLKMSEEISVGDTTFAKGSSVQMVLKALAQFNGGGDVPPTPSDPDTPTPQPSQPLITIDSFTINDDGKIDEANIVGQMIYLTSDSGEYTEGIYIVISNGVVFPLTTETEVEVQDIKDDIDELQQTQEEIINTVEQVSRWGII